MSHNLSKKGLNTFAKGVDPCRPARAKPFAFLYFLNVNRIILSHETVRFETN